MPAEKREDLVAEPTAADLLRDIRRSRIRQRIWIGLAAAQVVYLVVMVFWPSLLSEIRICQRSPVP